MIDYIIEWVLSCACVGFFLGGFLIIVCMKLLDDQLKLPR